MFLEVSDLIDVSEKNYTYTEMLQEAKLSTYLADNFAEWVPEMPEGVPPDDILFLMNTHYIDSQREQTYLKKIWLRITK